MMFIMYKCNASLENEGDITIGSSTSPINDSITEFTELNNAY